MDAYVRQTNRALDEMNALDLGERDPDTNAYVNTSRIFMLIELVNKLQEKIAKIVGTDALREVEVFRQKMEAKMRSEENANNLLPGNSKTNGQTIFI